MDISYYIAHPEKLNRETLYELRMLVRKYPCFDAVRLLLLKNLYLLHDIDFGKEMRSAALYLKNRRVLFDIMREYGNVDEMGQKLALFGALTLYLDFINLFLYLLRIFGDHK